MVENLITTPRVLPHRHYIIILVLVSYGLGLKPDTSPKAHTPPVKRFSALLYEPQPADLRDSSLFCRARVTVVEAATLLELLA